MLEAIGTSIPDAEVYPHAFAWYTIASKFRPEVREQWGGLKPLTKNDWKNAMDPEPTKTYDTKFADSLEKKKVEIKDEQWSDVQPKGAKKADDEEFDPFGDEDEDDEAAAESLRKAAD